MNIQKHLLANNYFLTNFLQNQIILMLTVSYKLEADKMKIWKLMSPEVYISPLDLAIHFTLKSALCINFFLPFCDLSSGKWNIAWVSKWKLRIKIFRWNVLSVHFLKLAKNKVQCEKLQSIFKWAPDALRQGKSANCI